MFFVSKWWPRGFFFVLLFHLSSSSLRPSSVSALFIKPGGVYKIDGAGLLILGTLNVTGIVRIGGEDLIERFTKMEERVNQLQLQFEEQATLQHDMQANLTAAWALIAEQQKEAALASRISVLESVTTAHDTRVSVLETRITAADVAAVAFTARIGTVEDNVAMINGTSVQQIASLTAFINQMASASTIQMAELQVNATNLHTTVANLLVSAQADATELAEFIDRLSAAENTVAIANTRLVLLQQEIAHNFSAVQDAVASELASPGNFTNLQSEIAGMLVKVQTLTDQLSVLNMRLTAVEGLNGTSTALTTTLIGIRDLTGSSAVVSNVNAAFGLTGTSTLVSTLTMLSLGGSSTLVSILNSLSTNMSVLSSTVGTGQKLSNDLQARLLNVENLSGNSTLTSSVKAAVAFGGSVTSLMAQFSSLVSYSSWIPILQFDGSSTGITYLNQIGHYTTIGRVCVVMFSIELTSKGTATGAATVTGLPNGVATYTAQSVEVSTRFSVLAYTGQVIARMAGVTVYFEQSASGGAISALTNSAFAGNSFIQGSISYEFG
jgi:hypothetical protein